MSKPLRLLLLEDNAADAELSIRELCRAGFDPQWQRVETEVDYLAGIDTTPDLILSDYALPRFDGMRALKLLQERGVDIPFILLSGTIGEDVAVEAMKQGATDYLLKDRIARLGSAVERALNEKRLRQSQRETEAAARASELRYRQLVENSPDAIVLHEKGRIVFANPAAYALLGVKAPGASLVGRAVLEISHPDYHREVMERVRIATAGTPVPLLEQKLIREDGTTVDVEVISIPTLHEGRPAVESIVHDISARKHAEAAQRVSEERLQLALKSSHIGVWDWDVCTGALAWDDAVCALHGLKPGEFGGRMENFLTLVHPADRANMEALSATLVAGSELADFKSDYRTVWPDGSVRFMTNLGRARRNASGRVDRIIGFTMDATAQKQTEQRLREQAELLDLATDAISVRELDGTIAYWSHGAEAVYGHRRENALGRNGLELKKQDPGAVAAATAEVLRAGYWSGELDSENANGDRLTVLSRWTLLRDESGEPRSILAIATDITERKRMEQHFLRAQRLDSVGTMASGIAHDLNNILAPIMIAVEVFRRQGMSEADGKLLDLIDESAQRGAAIVRQVLTFAGGMGGRVSRLSPAVPIRDMGRIMNETFPKDIAIQIDPSADLPEVMADPTQLHQVLLNLCVNARDAMPNGGVLTLTARPEVLDAYYCSMQPLATPGLFAHIAVRDTGSGVPPAIRDKIFDPFFTTKEHGKGTGLGLSTCIGIVRSHGGFMHLDSELGKGSTFSVFLPAAVGGQEEAKVAAPSASEASHGHGELILVVDDEERILEATNNLLVAHGFRTLTALDGTAALAIYSTRMSEIALVLTDLAMPHMDGIALAHVLRRMNPAVKMIAASGLPTEANRRKVAEAGVLTLIAKPYSAGDLLQAIARALAGPVRG